MNSGHAANEIVIAGDVTIDWNLIFFQSAQDTTTLWNANNMARACPQPGGAAMLAQLIETVFTNLGETHPVRIHAPMVSENGIHRRMNDITILTRSGNYWGKKSKRAGGFPGTWASIRCIRLGKV